MKIGAILVTSITLVEKVIIEKLSAKIILNNFVRNNKYIGSKDRKFLYKITFNTLKKYYGLINLCKSHSINISTRNLVLFNFFNVFKDYNLDDLYQGKYSLTKKNEDFIIYAKAICYEKEIEPKLPDWLEKKFIYQTELEKKSLYESMLSEPRFDIAININKYSREEVKKKLNRYDILCRDTQTSSVGISINNRIPKNQILKIKKDMFEVQDEGSQLMTLLVGVRPNMKILDFCAGKGTKTILISNLLKNEGMITVYDKFQERLEVLKKRVKKLKLKNINFNFDNKKKSIFDLVLCDVPCSGTGIWRRRPENIIWLRNQELAKLKLNQNNILIDAAKLCRNGGKLVYITCSLLYDENEYQIKKFLKNNKNFTLKNIEEYEENINKYLKKNIFKLSQYGLTLKPDTLNSDGYFISILKKSA